MCCSCQHYKTKRDDVEKTKAQLKELKKQVKEMKEANLSHKKSESDSDDRADSGQSLWKSV